MNILLNNTQNLKFFFFRWETNILDIFSMVDSEKYYIPLEEENRVRIDHFFRIINTYKKYISIDSLLSEEPNAIKDKNKMKDWSALKKHVLALLNVQINDEMERKKIQALEQQSIESSLTSKFQQVII